MYPLRRKPLESITPDDLQDLVHARFPEGRHVEFKQALYDGSDKDRKELVADVTSFANSDGGDIIIGIAQDDDGNAEELCGLPGINPDDVKNQLESRFTGGSLPSVRAIVHVMAIGERGHAIIIRVPKSWLAPHAVWIQKDSKFWERGSAGRIQMDVDRIKEAVGRNATLADRIRDFRESRIRHLTSNASFPNHVNAQPLVALHLVPFSAFDPGRTVDLGAIRTSGRVATLIGSGDYEYNVDGLMLIYRTATDPSNASYSLYFRNGCIETADDMLLPRIKPDARKTIAGRYLEKDLVQVICDHVAVLNAIGETGPIAVLLTLVGVQGWHVMLSETQAGKPIDRPILTFPEVVIPDLEQWDISTVVRPLFDMIWQSSGLTRSPNFTGHDGRWQAPP